MTTVHLLELETSQLVDTTVVATAIGVPKPQKNKKSIIEVTLSTEIGQEILFNFWDENHTGASEQAHVHIRRLLGGQGVWWSPLDGKGIDHHCGGDRYKAIAAAMSAANIASLPLDQKENLSKWDSGTSHEGPAANAHLGMLGSAVFFKQPLPDSLVTLEDTAEENLLTKERSESGRR